MVRINYLDGLKECVPVKWPPPTILMWNKMFGASLAESLINYNNNTHCSYKCIYTDNRSLEQQASLLVFHIRDNLDKMPEHRTPQQLYTFFILESPPHTWGLGRDVPPDFFNITMTYRADSDVHYPYDMFEEYTEKDLENGLVTYDQIWTEDEIDNKIEAKDKLALQFVSNCNTKSLRELYVNKLKNLTQITQIGTCLDGKRVCDKECADKLIDSHHFYFAFENSVCVNYVTEKFWKLKKLIVPVVLSRKIFKGLNIPDDSFIAADDFKSPKDLVSFLEKLAADKNRYKR
uniref:Fucosyltransferase n=1 Tax=Meloidogyne incognita TaxID=6306 RepID=A0A914MFW0_MELIC